MLLHVVEPTRHVSGFKRPKVHIEDARPRFLAAGPALLDQAAEQLRRDGLATETVLLESGTQRVSAQIYPRSDTKSRSRD